jgi:hypothetical protein
MNFCVPKLTFPGPKYRWNPSGIECFLSSFPRKDIAFSVIPISEPLSRLPVHKAEGEFEQARVIR